MLFLERRCGERTAEAGCLLSCVVGRRRVGRGQLSAVFARSPRSLIRLRPRCVGPLAGTAAQRRALAAHLVGSVLPLALQMYGCRVIQKALEVRRQPAPAQPCPLLLAVIKSPGPGWAGLGLAASAVCTPLPGWAGLRSANTL